MKTVIEKNLFAKKKSQAHATIDAVMGRGAYRTEAGAKRRAPVDTGRLRSSIETVRIGNMLWVVFTIVEYSEHQEYGTVFQSGTPFLRPSFEENYKAMIDELGKALAKL